MDKNTIWAITLSTIVIIGAFLIQPLIFPNKNQNDVVQTEVTEQVQQGQETTAELTAAETVAEAEEPAATEEAVMEQTFTVDTGLAEVVLTNKGGDIISYKLKNHFDVDTNSGVELSDNVSSFNRTCAIALGTSEKAIINENFNVEKIDDMTYLFKKALVINGKKVTVGKRYSFKKGEYVFKLDVLLHSDNADGLNDNGVAYTIRTSPQIGPHYDLKKNRYDTRQFIAYNGSKAKRIQLSDGKFNRYDKNFVWSGMAGKYFIELVIPQDNSILKSAVYSSKVETNNYANAQALLERNSFTGKDIQDTYYLYFGPRNEPDLKKYNVPENNAWSIGGYRVNESLQTYDWLRWLETILKAAMEKINLLIALIAGNENGNWGITIIILTILLKLILFPISKKQSLGTLKMQELQPKMQALQEKYRNDQQRLQMEMQKLYKEANYNPASGCLPMILQFLFLFAMFDLFNNYFEFRGAMFIPGWIPDLSTGDSVLKFGFTLPFFGNDLRLLPIIYLASQLLFSKITQNGGMNATQSQASMKFMTYGMPIIFFFLFYNCPAGLLLYWTVSNFFQMGQQIVINKMMAQKKAEMADTKKPVQKTLPPKNKRK